MRMMMLTVLVFFASCSLPTKITVNPSMGGGASSGGSSSVASGGSSSFDTGGSIAAAGSSELDACMRAELNLLRLQCKEATTPQGKPFSVPCRLAEKNNMNWHANCIAKVNSCDEVAKAYRGCE